MLNPHIMPYVGIVMLAIGCVITIVAMATDAWGKLETTVTIELFERKDTVSGTWGLFEVCLKRVVRGVTEEQCKSLERYPDYWNSVRAFEILAVTSSLLSIPLWCIWVFWKSPPSDLAFPWPKMIKIATITMVCLTAFWHAVAVAVWNAKDEGPPDVRQFDVSTGFSWGFAIFCIVWELLAMIPIMFSLPYYKRHSVTWKQPRGAHPMFRPDLGEGGMFPVEPGKEHPMFAGLDGDPRYPNMNQGPRTFLDSLPDERGSFKYDPELDAIVPRSVSRNTGRHMLGHTWGRQDAPFPPVSPLAQPAPDTPPKQGKSRLQMLKETWSKREGFKFGFGTKSKADDSAVPSGSITGKPAKKKSSAGKQVDNSAPLFVKTLWNNQAEDTFEDILNKQKNYENEEEDEEKSEEVESGAVDENEENVYHLPASSGDEEEKVVTVHNPNIRFKKKGAERKNYNLSNDDDDNNNGVVNDVQATDTNFPKDTTKSNFSFKKKVVERKNFNVPSDSEVEKEDNLEEDLDNHLGSGNDGHENNDSEATYENLPKDIPASTFSFKKKVVERKNYNVPSDDEVDNEDQEEDMDNYLGPDIQIKATKRSVPGIPVHPQSDRTRSRTSDDEYDASQDMYTSSYGTGFDPPSSGITLDMGPGGPGESDDALEERHWTKQHDIVKNKQSHQNFAYLNDVTDDQNTTEI